MLLFNFRVREVLRKLRIVFRIIILVDLDLIFNGLKIQGGLIRMLGVRNRVRGGEVTLGSEVGGKRKNILGDLRHIREEMLLIMMKINNWSKLFNPNALETNNYTEDSWKNMQIRWNLRNLNSRCNYRRVRQYDEDKPDISKKIMQ